MDLYELCAKRDEVIMADFITENVRNAMLASLERQIEETWNNIRSSK